MQARGFLNYSFKYCWPKVIYCSLRVYQINCTCLQNELKRDIKKKTGEQAGGQAKIWGVWPTQVPLRIATGPDIIPVFCLHFCSSNSPSSNSSICL